MVKKNIGLNQNLKLLVKSSIIVFIGLLLSKILFYGYRIITARYFGAEVYGLLSISIMVLGWFIAIASLGLSDGVLRYISLLRGKNQLNKMRYIFKTSLWVVFILGILSSLLLFSTSGLISNYIFHNGELAHFLKIFSIIIPFTLISYIFLSVIKAYERIQVYSFILNIFQNLIKVAVLILLVFIGVKSNAVIFSYILGTIAMFIFAYIYSKYKLSELWDKYYLKKNDKIKLRNQLLSYSWPLMFFSLVAGILPWIDTIVLGYYQNVAIVGIYNVAVPIAMLLNFSGEIFMQLFFPLITREYSLKNIKAIRELSKQVGKWIFMINLPILIIMLIFPGTIINFLFGPEYISASNPLRILAIGFFISSIFMVSDNLIAIIGKSRLSLINIIIASIFNFILNILLVPKYGMMGAALGTMFAFILWSLLRASQAYYYLKILPLRRKMFLILITSLIPTALIYFLRYKMPINTLSLIILGLLFGLTYIILLFLTRCFDENDWMILGAFKRKIFGDPILKNNE